MTSVVIPAHNEELVIGRSLVSLLHGARPGEFDIVVVANACTDDTAAVARRLGVRVVETPLAGKANALRLGDAACRSFPRLYLDADVEFTADGLRALAASLDDGVLACSPVPEFDLTGVSWVARRFHDTHELLMAHGRGLAGAGAYMLSEQGHRRVFPLPDVIADDALVHRAFEPEQRKVVAAARSVVRPPGTFGALVRRRSRIRQGNAELDGLGRRGADGGIRTGRLAALVGRGVVSPVSALCFMATVCGERVVTLWRRSRGSGLVWSRDDTSRVTNP